MTDDQITTLHPQGKQGVNMAREKYGAVRRAILEAIHAAGELPFAALAGAVEERLPPDFEGSVGWHTTTVKLDLEARGLIERLPGRGLQRLRIVDDW